MIKKLFIIIFLLNTLNSCNFKPVNTFLKNEYNIELAQIKFGNINSEYKQYFINYLYSEFNPENLELEKKMVLNVNITSAVESLLVQKDSTINRQEIKFDINYEIKNISNNRIITKGSFPLAVSYAETSSIYSSYINKEYSYKNGLKEISRQLKLRSLIAVTKNSLDENSSKRN